MNPDDLIALNEEIAAMARAGLPLDKGLAALAREMNRGQLQNVTEELALDLAKGHTLPEALDRQGGRVPPFYGALVTAGVRTGRIGEVLSTLTAYTRSMSDLRNSILEAMLYPILVIVFALGLMTLLLTSVIPQFEKIYRDFGMSLPIVTQWALVLGHYSTVIILTPVIVVVVLVILWLWMRATAAGQRTWARLVYSVPLVGTLLRASRLAGFTDLLAIMVEHEVPLPEAFRMAGQASSDPLTAYSAQQVYEELGLGRALGDALQSHGLVPEWVAWMVGTGQQRGALGSTLRQIAVMYRQQAEARAAMLRNFLPSFLIVLTAGIFVAIFVFALFAPMIKLLEGLAK
jgi:type II secretory pathway component PulF